MTVGKNTEVADIAKRCLCILKNFVLFFVKKFYSDEENLIYFYRYLNSELAPYKKYSSSTLLEETGNKKIRDGCAQRTGRAYSPRGGRKKFSDKKDDAEKNTRKEIEYPTKKRIAARYGPK